jgi:hypothetical protein
LWQGGFAFGGESKEGCTRESVDSFVEVSGLEGDELEVYLRSLSEGGCVWGDYPLYELLYFSGGDVVDFLHLLRRSARSGDERSLKRLGSYYSFGSGVKKDLVAAYALYRMSEVLGGRGSGFLAKKIGRNMSEEEVLRASRWQVFWEEKWREDGKMEGGVLSDEESQRFRLEP